MNLDQINRTRTIARQVIDLLDQVEAEIYAQHDDHVRVMSSHIDGYKTAPAYRLSVGTRRSGELRRRSLDLSRALSDLRRP